MRVPWKYIGLAGLASVAATGAVVARQRRAQRTYDPAELRGRLHQRLAEVSRAEDERAEARGAPGAGSDAS